jgi:hypothetical protein
MRRTRETRRRGEMTNDASCTPLATLRERFQRTSRETRPTQWLLKSSQPLAGVPTAVPTLRERLPFGNGSAEQRTSRQSRPTDCLPVVRTGVGNPFGSSSWGELPRPDYLTTALAPPCPITNNQKLNFEF